MSRSWEEILHDPRIDDSGDYDYYAEELPENYAYKVTNCRCDNCGKYRLWAKRSVSYFYCYDGWDSMRYTECWVCNSKIFRHIRKIKYKIRKKVKLWTVRKQF